MEISKLIQKIQADTLLENRIITRNFNYIYHSNLIKEIAGKNFDFDDKNKNVFKLLLYYFNGSSIFESMFPNEKYSLRKGLMLIGNVGTGKTDVLKIYQKYCNFTNFPARSFIIVDIREVSNYFQSCGNIDMYTYNNNNSRNIRNYCFDDLGSENDTIKYYGTDYSPVFELILDRYNIFCKYKKVTHFTTNLGLDSIHDRYGERIYDRMKEMLNIIVMSGKSRRK